MKVQGKQTWITSNHPWTLFGNIVCDQIFKRSSLVNVYDSIEGIVIYLNSLFFPINYSTGMHVIKISKFS